MIKKLSIRNYTLIDELNIEFNSFGRYVGLW